MLVLVSCPKCTPAYKICSAPRSAMRATFHWGEISKLEVNGLYPAGLRIAVGHRTLSYPLKPIIIKILRNYFATKISWTNFSTICIPVSATSGVTRGSLVALTNLKLNLENSPIMMKYGFLVSFWTQNRKKSFWLKSLFRPKNGLFMM